MWHIAAIFHTIVAIGNNRFCIGPVSSVIICCLSLTPWSWALNTCMAFVLLVTVPTNWPCEILGWDLCVSCSRFVTVHNGKFGTDMKAYSKKSWSQETMQTKHSSKCRYVIADSMNILLVTWDFRFSRRWEWRMQSSETLYSVTNVGTDV
jgi:hypothetical protein